MIPRRVSSDPESFRFVWEKSGVPLSVDVRLETPNRLRGRWTFVHPQYQYEGEGCRPQIALCDALDPL